MPRAGAELRQRREQRDGEGRRCGGRAMDRERTELLPGAKKWVSGLLQGLDWGKEPGVELAF